MAEKLREKVAKFRKVGATKYAGKRKMARVEPQNVHADFRPRGIAPRVGKALLDIAKGGDSNHALLAEGILRTGDHSLLPILGDALQDVGHEHENSFDWKHLPRGIAIDQALEREMAARQEIRMNPDTGHPERRGLIPGDFAWRWYNGETGAGQPLSRRAAVQSVRQAVPDANLDDVVHSLLRAQDRWQHRNNQGSLPDIDPWEAADDSMRVERMAGRPLTQPHTPDSGGLAEPHKYPDTRTGRRKRKT
jgi:hypothetical protein